MKTSMRLAMAGGVAAAVLVVAGIGMGMGGRGAGASPNVAAGEAKTFTVDPVHSNVVFKVKHLNASNFYGRFDKVMGSFSVGETASFDVKVEAASVNTNNSKRDDHVKSPDFFSAKEFPEISFSGKDFKKSGDSWKGSGALTLHGVTKTVEVEVKQTGMGPGMGGKGEIAGVETSFTIKRTDYGVKGMVGPLGDEVTLWVALEGGVK